MTKLISLYQTPLYHTHTSYFPLPPALLPLHSDMLRSFNSKLLKPFKRLVRLSCLPYKRITSSIQLGIFRNRNIRRDKTSRKKHYLSVFRWLRMSSSEEMDRIREMRSFVSDRDHHEPFPSPLTLALIKLMAARRLKDEIGIDDDDTEEACRSFENYLVEMIVEEGKVRDLVDFEELLYSWSSLKSPVFVDLVSRFYGELCKDLFSHNNQN